VHGGAKTIVICAGLYGSGSTWCFNAARKLLSNDEADESEIFSLYSDNLTHNQDAGLAMANVAVIKTHCPSPGMRCLAREASLPTFVTIRDPRDCVVSMMQRFSMSFERSLAAVTSSAKSISAWTSLAPAHPLRFEDGFTNVPQTLRMMADVLGVSPPESRYDAVFASLSPAAVRQFVVRRFDGLDTANAEQIFDAATHWHPGHVGDGAVGKFSRLLSEAEIEKVEGANFLHAAVRIPAKTSFGRVASALAFCRMDFVPQSIGGHG
jgi:Sulfotransferase domain